MLCYPVISLDAVQPVGRDFLMHLDDVVESLTFQRDAIHNLYRGVPTDHIRWKPAPDRWSVLEVLCHLADIEVEDFRHDLDLILNAPDEPWPNFNIETWVVERRYNQQDPDATLRRFLDERHASIAWLSGLGGIDLSLRHSGNGFGGPGLSAGDVLASWVAHDLFHIRQIALLGWEILIAHSGHSPRYSGFEP